MTRNVDYSKWDKLEVSDDEDDRRPVVTRFEKPKTVQFGTTATPVRHESASWSRNGADCGDLAWSQTADTVTVYVRVPGGTRARQVDVNVTASRLRVSLDAHAHADVLLKSPVDDSDDAVDGCWELVDDAGASGRAVAISLRKKALIGGVVHWWAQLRAADTPIDVTALQDRPQPKESFADVWKQAHELFRERVAAIKPTEIEVEDQESPDAV